VSEAPANAIEASPVRRGAVAFIFVTILLDMFALGLIMPILPKLVESFVEQERFEGTCYRAANWLKIGQTQGRTRNDRWHQGQAPIKDIYLWPVVRDFRRRCCAL